nr:hypothetical protein [Tanacetum cinerariifolium]
MINQDIKDSKASKTYYDFATEKVALKKARKFKKIDLPSRKMPHVKEAEPVKKDKKVKRPAKKSTIVPTTGVVIKDTHGVSVSKNKEPPKADRGKEVPDESKAKPFDTSKGTGVKPEVPDVLKPNSSDSDNKSWGNSEDKTDDVNDDVNDDDNDDGNANDDDSGNEDDDGNDAHVSERTDSEDDYKNLSFTLKDYDKEENDKENESDDDDNENVYEEEDEDLYKDVDMRSLGAEHEKERKGNEEMTNADQNVFQEKSYKQVIEDAHVTLTSSEKTESSKQSSSVSSDFASKFLILDNLNVALWMFTRRVVILKRVENLQLGAESYQKKLNITKPTSFRYDISKMTPYTAYKNPQGIIYPDKYKQNRLMRLDELYKFCDRTLTPVRNVLHDIANNLRMEYQPKRK